jgi:hypothetical protein
MKAAEASLHKQWPDLTPKEASAEVVSAIAYASSHHAAWLWNGVGVHLSDNSGRLTRLRARQRRLAVGRSLTALKLRQNLFYLSFRLCGPIASARSHTLGYVIDSARLRPMP